MKSSIADGFDVSEHTALDWILAEFRADIEFEVKKAGGMV